MLEREIYDSVLNCLYDEYEKINKEVSGACAECQGVYPEWLVEKLDEKVKNYVPIRYRIVAFREGIAAKIASLLDVEKQEFTDTDTLAILRELSALQVKFQEQVDSPFDSLMRLLYRRQATMLLQYAKDNYDLKLKLDTTEELFKKAREGRYCHGVVCEEEE